MLLLGISFVLLCGKTLNSRILPDELKIKICWEEIYVGFYVVFYVASTGSDNTQPSLLISDN